MFHLHSVGLRLCLGAALPCLAYTQALEFHGDIGTRQAYGLSTNSAAQSRYEINLQASKAFAKSCAAKLAYRLRVDQYLGPRAEYDVDLREAWLNCIASGWLFSVGRQFVIWGKADGFPLLDAVHPFDYRQFFVDGLQSDRRSLAMIRIEKHVGRSDFLQALFIPEKREDILPRLGDRFSNPFLPELALVRQAVPIGPANGSRFSRPAGGFKWEHDGRKFGWTANVLDGWSTQPYFVKNPGSGVLLSKYYRRPLLGTSFDLQLSRWIVREELTSLPDVYLPEASVLVKYQKYRQTSFVVGIDRAVGEWLLSVQLYRALSSSGAVSPAGGRTNELLTFLAMRSFVQDRVKARAFVAGDATHHGAWMQTQLIYDIRERFEIRLEGDWFQGSTASTLGKLDGENRISLALKWSF